MILPVQQIWDATLLISAIIRDRRPMPQRGKFHLARMHARLMPEWTVASARRDELIEAYHCWNDEAQAWAVPPEMTEHFNAAWKDIASIEIDVEVQPVALADLDLAGQNGGIEAHELALLGELVVE
jgi:hypothetical protein